MNNQPPASHLTDFLAELRDNAEITERCAICGWAEWFSTAAEGRQAAEEHRRQFHPRQKAKKYRRKR